MDASSHRMMRHVRRGLKWLAGSRNRNLTCACVAALLVAGCHRPTPSPVVTIAHEITPQPVRAGPATIALRLTDASGKAVTGARVTLEGNMSHAGMAPVLGDARETEPGRYKANLQFTMGGDWIVLVHLTMSDGQKLEQQFDVKGVR